MEDYQESQAVWSMTTIRVLPNMDDVYLEARSDELDRFAQTNYPAMREITGQYLMRKITFAGK